MKRFLFLGAVIASVATLLGSPPSASAATPFPGDNGVIVFGKTVDGQHNLWDMRADGTHKKQLTRTGAANPSWSPDGRYVVFTNNYQQLQMMDYQNGSVRMLTPAHYSVISTPVWSRDGSRIVFVAAQQASGQKQQAVLAMSIDTARVSPVALWTAQFAYQSPSWSPDGTQVVYERMNAQSAELIITNLAQKLSRTLTTLSDVVPAHSSWAPNGKKILYSDSADEVYTIWPDGSHRSTIADGESYDASWLPNGNGIVFLEAHNGEGLSLSGADGSVTNIPLFQGKYDTIAAPTMSPDGTKILFAMTDVQTNTTDLFSLDWQQPGAKPVKLAANVTMQYDWQARAPQN